MAPWVARGLSIRQTGRPRRPPHTGRGRTERHPLPWCCSPAHSRCVSGRRAAASRRLACDARVGHGQGPRLEWAHRLQATLSPLRGRAAARATPPWGLPRLWRPQHCCVRLCRGGLQWGQRAERVKDRPAPPLPLGWPRSARAPQPTRTGHQCCSKCPAAAGQLLPVREGERTRPGRERMAGVLF